VVNGSTFGCPLYRDRKRKRFVGGGTETNKKKKIKTESGHWIDATYKSGMYPFFGCYEQYGGYV